ncbi:MAG: hypothetical protein HFE26_01680 [Clostridia bacterium]|nr:hypothetical protein [Clostridia bacterium]
MKIESAIEQMVLGKRGDIDHIELDEEGTRICDLLSEQHKKLKIALQPYPEIAKLLNEFIDTKDLALCNETLVYYKEGLRFGILLGMDILSND